MSSARMVRTAKTRFVLLALLLFVFVALTYLYHSSQTKVDELKKHVANCDQQQESLAAQLQVIFEYKLRLEKSLQKEKAEHKETKEECQNKAQEEKIMREKETNEAVDKYNALSQHFKLLESSHKDLTEDCDKIRKAQLENVDDITTLENKIQSLLQELKQVQESKNKTVETWKLQFEELQKENDRLKKENARLKSSPDTEQNKLDFVSLENELKNTKTALEQCRAGKPVSMKQEQSEAAPNAQAVGPTPNKAPLPKEDEFNMGLHLTGSSTTPVINPEAVMDHDVPMKVAQKGNVPPLLAIPIQRKQDQQQQQQQQQSYQYGGGDQQQMAESAHQLAAPDNMAAEAAVAGAKLEENAPVADQPKQSEDLFEPGADVNGGVSNENKKYNHMMQDLNGALEELEDPQKPDHEIPRPKHHQYQGGDYDKEEGDNEDEGEQLDYMVGGEAKHQPPPAPLPHQQSLQRQNNGGSIMVNPK
ncbi:Golgi integral membrane protein 4 isoform X2 [Nilaparvata lugens]|uniref:Golgi integral membrane protein 4 isoform X2 n=1 Tax=Nilaparvata lugens TaxID=108931 RepID=UPI00193E8CF2|nr:Golgi integral membrane protein 4 isoform X2 [Nilaparvata lugens]